MNGFHVKKKSMFVLNAIVILGIKIDHGENIANKENMKNYKEEFISSSILIIRKHEKFSVDIDGWIQYSIDRSYGEDSDGGRASSKIIVEDVRDVQASNEDGYIIDLSKEEMNQAIEELTQKFITQ